MLVFIKSVLSHNWDN